MKKNNKKLMATLLTAGMIIVTGCSGQQTSTNQPSTNEIKATASVEKIGTLLLSVNPEIEIEYDHNGTVLEIEGLNKDGSDVILALADFEGKSVNEVVSALVDKIYDSGYFETTINGQPRNIVLKFEEGSRYPGDNFINELAAGVEETIAARNLSSATMVVENDDYQKDGYISEEKAKEIVLAQVGLSEATFTEHDYDLEDGVYELEFFANGKEYEFEVNAVNGKVMEADVENEDWDDYKERTENTAPATTSISKERAKEIALAKAGITTATFTEEKFDADDNDYEFEFHADGKEYECEVNASNGRVKDYDVDVQD